MRPELADGDAEQGNAARGTGAPQADPLAEGRVWRVSSGSAAVLGLRPTTVDAAPTTAYLLLGGRCHRDCAFCAQARESRAPEGALSRVMWPAFPREAVAGAIAGALERGAIVRACFQVTDGAGALDEVGAAVRQLAGTCHVPICVSAATRALADVEALLEAGAERVTIALDAATPAVYRRVKGGSWERTWALLEEGAARYPGRIGTHLIVGLGESERDLVTQLQRLVDLGVTIGLFAFTPVPGTALASAAAPPLAAYRRVQAVRWLLAHGLVRAEACSYDDAGRLTSLGMEAAALRRALADGEAFRTAGCPGCNRPYYNERPGGVMYNYPRPLAPREAAEELTALLATLDADPDSSMQPSGGT